MAKNIVYLPVYFDKSKMTTINYPFIPTPEGALLWLRNHTIGVEERIFTYSDEKIKFW